jgi:hypothetical protein
MQYPENHHHTKCPHHNLSCGSTASSSAVGKWSRIITSAVGMSQHWVKLGAAVHIPDVCDTGKTQCNFCTVPPCCTCTGVSPETSGWQEPSGNQWLTSHLRLTWVSIKVVYEAKPVDHEPRAIAVDVPAGVAGNSSVGRSRLKAKTYEVLGRSTEKCCGKVPGHPAACVFAATMLLAEQVTTCTDSPASL